jgi:hypothetical protein
MGLINSAGSGTVHRAGDGPRDGTEPEVVADYSAAIHWPVYRVVGWICRLEKIEDPELWSQEFGGAVTISSWRDVTERVSTDTRRHGQPLSLLGEGGVSVWWATVGEAGVAVESRNTNFPCSGPQAVQ